MYTREQLYQTTQVRAVLKSEVVPQQVAKFGFRSTTATNTRRQITNGSPTLVLRLGRQTEFQDDMRISYYLFHLHTFSLHNISFLKNI